MKNILLTLIVFGIIGGAYWYLAGYDNMREQKFNAMHECMKKHNEMILMNVLMRLNRIKNQPYPKKSLSYIYKKKYPGPLR